MGKLIGKIEKSYFINKREIENDFNSLIEKDPNLKGEISSNYINLESRKTYRFNIYEKPTYTINGQLKSSENGTEIQLKIETYFGEEIIGLWMVIMSLIIAGLSIYDYYNPIFTRGGGKYFFIPIGIVFIVGIFRLYVVYKRKKKGEIAIENVILELKNV